MRDKALPICAAKIYNSLPQFIRSHDSDDYKSFKALLDDYLSTIPDEPIVPGLVTSNLNNECRPSNSIIDWNRNMRNIAWTPAELQSAPYSSII